MSYNAVLKKVKGEVLGRVTLSNLKSLPKTWEVHYDGEIIPNTTDLKTLLCDSKVPLSVYIEPIEVEITVGLDFFTMGLALDAHFPLVFSCPKHYNIKDLKLMIKETLKRKSITLNSITLYLEYTCDEVLKDCKTVDEIVVKRKCTVYLRGEIQKNGKQKNPCGGEGSSFTAVDLEAEHAEGKIAFKTPNRKRRYLRYDKIIIRDWRNAPGGCGPGTFSAVNLEAEHVEGKGVPVRNRWEGYSYGLNIYGTCPKQSCPSHKTPLKLTSYRAGYGSVRIDLNNDTLPCSACRGRFPPGNFVVCHGRALFRFKKTEGHFEVQTTLLQSFGGLGEYAKFHDGGEETHVEYDWIEVNTVRKDRSLHVCSRCDIPIRLKVDAALYDCGHPVHRSCMEDECRLCNAQSLSEREFSVLVQSTANTAGPRGTGGKRRRN